MGHGGAWGNGVFENDQAGDWLNQLAISGKTTAIDKALSFAVKAKTGLLEADEACEALAAAEVVAAGRGHRHADLPSDVKEWLTSSEYLPAESSVALATKAVERVRDDSDLVELWAEGDELPAWKRGISGLLKRLAEPAKPPKPKKVSARLKAPPKPSPRTAAGALKKKGVHVVKSYGSTVYDFSVGGGHPTDKHPLSDDDMVHFRQINSLQQLKLNRYPQVSDLGAQFLAGLTKLKQLELTGLSITDASAAIFDSFTELEQLKLSQTQVGDAVLERIGRMKNLAELDLEETALTDAGLNALRGCPALWRLNLNGTQVGDPGAKILAEASALRILILDRTAITTAGLPVLQTLPELTRLGLEGTNLNDEACSVLARFPQLEGLDLGGTHVTGLGLRPLLNAPKLRDLNLSSTMLSDDDVPMLLELSSRMSIYAPKTHITAKGKKQIEKSGVSNIHV